MSRRPLALTLLCAPLFAQEQAHPAQLRHELTSGSPFHFAIEVDSTTSFEDGKRDSSMRFAMRFAAKPETSPDGATPVVCTLEALVVHADSKTTTIRFDSTDTKQDSGPLQRLRELTGAQFRLSIEPNGKIRSAEVPENLAKLATEHLGSDFRNLFAAYFVPLPDAPKSKGDEWQTTTRMFGERIGGVETTTRMRLDAIADGRAEIGMQFEPATPPQRPGVQFEMRRADGKLVVDVAHGRVLTAEATLLARATRISGNASPTGTSELKVRASLLPDETAPTPARPPENGSKN